MYERRFALVFMLVAVSQLATDAVNYQVQNEYEGVVNIPSKLYSTTLQWNIQVNHTGDYSASVGIYLYFESLDVPYSVDCSDAYVEITNTYWAVRYCKSQDGNAIQYRNYSLFSTDNYVTTISRTLFWEKWNPLTVKFSAGTSGAKFNLLYFADHCMSYDQTFGFAACPDSAYGMPSSCTTLCRSPIPQYTYDICWSGARIVNETFVSGCPTSTVPTAPPTVATTASAPYPEIVPWGTGFRIDGSVFAGYTNFTRQWTLNASSSSGIFIAFPTFQMTPNDIDATNCSKGDYLGIYDAANILDLTGYLLCGSTLTNKINVQTASLSSGIVPSIMKSTTVLFVSSSEVNVIFRSDSINPSSFVLWFWTDSCSQLSEYDCSLSESCTGFCNIPPVGDQYCWGDAPRYNVSFSISQQSNGPSTACAMMNITRVLTKTPKPTESPASSNSNVIKGISIAVGVVVFIAVIAFLWRLYDKKKYHDRPTVSATVPKQPVQVPRSQISMEQNKQNASLQENALPDYVFAPPTQASIAFPAVNPYKPQEISAPPAYGEDE